MNRLLVSAVKNNYPTTVKKLLDNGANPNIHIGNYDSMLTYSIEKEYNKISKILLEAGANPNTPNALYTSVFYGNYEIIDYLVEKNVVIKPDTMFSANKKNYEKIIKKLISYGLDINYIRYNETLLVRALNYGNCEEASILLKLGANPNIHNHIKIPIFYAIANCKKNNNLELLLKKGADVNVQDIDGFTPLMCVVYYYSIQRYSKTLVITYIKLLLKYGADITLRSIDGNDIFNFMEDYINDPNERSEINKLILEYNTEPIKLLTYLSKKRKIPLPIDLVKEIKKMLY